MQPETLGARIARLRKEKGFTQEELGEKVGLSSQAISKWENDISSPDITALPLLAKLFEITVDGLLSGEGREVQVVKVEKQKDISQMFFRIYVDSKEGDKVRVNLPVSIIKLCLEGGLTMPTVNGNDTLKNIDWSQIFVMIEQGVIGELVEVESADGDTVRIVVE